MPHYYDRVLQERIWLSDEENSIVELSEFQRLKKIKQNGFSFVKYPDATNTRFDHSIGVVYWVTKLYQSIFPEKSIILSDNDELRALRLSALIHDVGHGPYSHVFETLLTRNDAWYDKSPWKGLKKKYKTEHPHEFITLNIFERKIRSKINDEKISSKVNLILKNEDKLSLLISGDLDADRLDYLTRDSHYSGLPFGFNIKTIFNEILEQNLSIKPINSKYFLCIQSETVAAFELYLMARYAHYKYIAYEPSILKANLIFISLLEKSLETKINNDNTISKVLYYIYTKLTDDELINLNFIIPKRVISKELGDIRNDKKLKNDFINLVSLVNDQKNSSYIRLVELEKRISYCLLKAKGFRIRSAESIFKKTFKNNIKIMPFLPSTSALQTCVEDKSVNVKYNPLFLYDYSPILQGLEQKMFLDCGFLFLYDKFVKKNELINEFNTLSRDKADFDFYTYGIVEFLSKIYKKYTDDYKYLQVRRTKLIEFFIKFSKELSDANYIETSIKSVNRYYSKQVYEILQILEFLDVINEDFNIVQSNGLIPSYVYSLGEHAKTIMAEIKLDDDEIRFIEKIVEELIPKDKSWWEV